MKSSSVKPLYSEKILQATPYDHNLLVHIKLSITHKLDANKPLQPLLSRSGKTREILYSSNRNDMCLTTMIPSGSLILEQLCHFDLSTLRSVLLVELTY